MEKITDSSTKTNSKKSLPQKPFNLQPDTLRHVLIDIINNLVTRSRKLHIYDVYSALIVRPSDSQNILPAK